MMVPNRFTRWLLTDATQAEHAAEAATHHTRPWWQVMCLSGVDYFSTLGYQPGIAALAAGALSPIATIVLVLLTLFGALPIYRRVAAESPHGEGSIAMLEHLLSWWQGKFFVLALLGFAATDFIITITLSAADATAHIIENPFIPHAAEDYRVLITLVLIGLLGTVFLIGFREAIIVAVALAVPYILLNVVVVVRSFSEIAAHPELISGWQERLNAAYTSWPAMVGAALLVFPKLALGLSGFETGVSVMPLVRGAPGDTYRNPIGRIRNTRKLLTLAALIMSVLLICSSFATIILIPPDAFLRGGEANGRALAYLAHEYLGDGFGTIYDVVTIAILWFAGASAMAGLLNIVPRYLPRYGMAPEWARHVRPLVFVFTAVAFIVTIIFRADVDAQGGAYATGVLMLMTSAAVAVTISARRANQRRLMYGFGVIAAVFIYTTIVNVIERPEGMLIASIFIVSIVVVSIVSRIMRATELRVGHVELDSLARQYVTLCARRNQIRIIANHLDDGDPREYAEKEREVRADTHLPADVPLLFLEIDVADASQFSQDIFVTGAEVDGYRILRCRSGAVPNAIAAVLLHIRNETGKIPHIYFSWGEGGPWTYLVRFIMFGLGDIPPTTREIIRRAERDPERRPVVHVGG